MAQCACCGKNTVPDYAADHLGVDECTACTAADETPQERRRREDEEEAAYWAAHPEEDAARYAD